MAQSTYQVERLIDRLRRFAAWLPWPQHLRWRGEDPVRMGAQARHAAQAAAQATAQARAARPPTPQSVRERRGYLPVVEAERERRAGSFMEPPYLPDGLPSIPRRGERPRPRKPARPLTEG